MKLDYILLYVSDLDKTASFYGKLGFEIAKRTENKVVVKLGDFELHCYDQSKVFFKQDVDRFKGAGVFIYISADDVDGKYSELMSKGLQPSGKPKDFEWENKEFAIKDPDDYKIIFYKNLT